MKNNLQKHYPTIFTFLFFIVALLVGKSFDILTLPQFFIGVICFIALMFISLFIINYENNARRKGEIDGIINRLIEIVSASKPEKYDFIIEDSELIEIEGKIDCKEIWIITRDLTKDTYSEGAFVAVMKRNLNRNIKYTYLVPKNYLIDSKLTALSNVFSSKPHLLELRQISEKKFMGLTYTNIAIYNPENENNKKAKVCVNLPLNEYSYWIQPNENISEQINGRISEAIKNSVKITVPNNGNRCTTP